MQKPATEGQLVHHGDIPKMTSNLVNRSQQQYRISFSGSVMQELINMGDLFAISIQWLCNDELRCKKEDR